MKLLRVLALAWLALLAGPSIAADAEVPEQLLVMLDMPAAHFHPEGNYSGGYANAAGRAASRRLANELAREHGLRIVSEWPMPVIGVDCYVMEVPKPRTAAAIAAQLNGRPRVSWAQPMHEFEAMGHDDPLFALQPAAAEWHLAQLHDIATGRGVRVAVIDSGVQPDHPDLMQQMDLRRNMVAEMPDVPEQHGTAVAGIIAARADNHAGIVGVAPHARLLALRACWQSADATRCHTLGLALALNAAIEQHAQIINMSLGGPPDILIQRLVRAAIEHGATVVAAARQGEADGGFPASIPGVVAVRDGPPARGGNFLFAPGTDVITTLPASRWGVVTGSSYAAAHVSGLLALVEESRARGHLPVGFARTALQADLVIAQDGRIDACATLAKAAHSCVCACDTMAGMESGTRR